VEAGKKGAIAKSRQERIDDIVRTQREWRKRRRSRLPVSAAPAQNLSRKMVGLGVFRIQKLGSNENRVARGRACTIPSLQERAVIAFDIATFAMKDNDGTRNLGLTFGPIERYDIGIYRRPLWSGYTKSLSRYACNRLGLLGRVQFCGRPCQPEGCTQNHDAVPTSKQKVLR
jgi:hypothetical protein